MASFRKLTFSFFTENFIVDIKEVTSELHSERVTSQDEKGNNFGSERLVIAVLITMAIASACGFFAGYRLSRWRLIQDGQHHSSGSSTG